MSDLQNPGVKAVITLAVLAVIAILATITAKLVQYCVKNKYSDDNDDISENTRDLIRARLSVIQFIKKDTKKPKKNKTVNIFRKWHEIVLRRKNDRVDALNFHRPEGVGKVVVSTAEKGEIKVKETGKGETQSKANGVVEQNDKTPLEYGTPRILRNPSFVQNISTENATKQESGAAPKSSAEIARMLPPRILPSNIVKESPVPRGRPVSSKTRALPNVTLTNETHALPNITLTNVDINNSVKVKMKTVHFELNTAETNSENNKDRT